MSGKTRHTRPFPPLLGYGMGITVYSWTSTAGATEIIFALFDLLGYCFTPQLRDLGNRRGEVPAH